MEGANEIHSGGGGAGLSFANRETGTFEEDGADPAGNVGARWVWYASGRTARLWSGTDKLHVTPQGNLTLIGGPGDARAGAMPGELFLGGFRTSLSGFDPAGFHWIRSNANEDDMWMAFANPGSVDPFVKRIMVVPPMFGPSFPVVSDTRTKTNIQQLGGVLDKLERIRGVAFEWAESPQALACAPGRSSIGVTAQEVEAVFPELVSVYNAQGYKAVDYSGLTSVLLEAAKELKAENEALRSRIEALERAA